jgi:expansin (peptidoglycan-binding protein)
MRADRGIMRRTLLALGLLAWGTGTESWASRTESGCPGSWTGSGQATYYEAFDEPNACGLPLVPTDYVVAVGEAAFDGSAVCGRCLRVTGPLGTVVALVTDYCVGPGCLDLDLSPNAFAAIGKPSDGIIPVVWESVACEDPGPVAFHFHADSNLYYAKIQVRNHRHGIAGLSVAPFGGDFVELERRKPRCGPAPRPAARPRLPRGGARREWRSQRAW